ncbi:unnamed protein product [Closterium sp. Naga37s-1]|nr:unnamed protein product [Closterium sp. Naga37s-1]
MVGRYGVKLSPLSLACPCLFPPPPPSPAFPPNPTPHQQIFQRIMAGRYGIFQRIMAGRYGVKLSPPYLLPGPLGCHGTATRFESLLPSSRVGRSERERGYGLRLSPPYLLPGPLGCHGTATRFESLLPSSRVCGVDGW